MSKYLTVLAVFAAALVAQDRATFRAGTRLVLVDVVVHTRSGPVTGLSKDDFTLTDNGKPQQIAEFSMTDARSAATSAIELPPTAGSNRRGSVGEAVSPTIILFDRLNTTDPKDQANARRQIIALLGTIKATDRVEFLSLGQSLMSVHSFGDDPEVLVRIAKRLGGSAGGAAPDNEKAKQAALEDALRPLQPMDRQVRVAVTDAAFRQIARHLGGLKGRRNLIWITSEFPTTYPPTQDRMADMEAEIDRARSILSDANIALYAVAPPGVNASNRATTNNTPAEATRMSRGPSQNETIYMTDTLRELARSTGGEAFYNTNDMSPVLRTVLDSSAVSYTLGFYPDKKSLDNKLHDLGVKVKGNAASGAALEYRKKYFASKASPDWQRMPLPSLANDTLDATAIGLVVASALDAQKSGFDTVEVKVDANDLQFEQKNGKWSAVLDMAISADTPGQQGGINRTLNLDLSDDQLKQARVSGLVVSNSLPSSVGRIRVVVQDHNSGAAGSMRLQLAK